MTTQWILERSVSKEVTSIYDATIGVSIGVGRGDGTVVLSYGRKRQFHRANTPYGDINNYMARWDTSYIVASFRRNSFNIYAIGRTPTNQRNGNIRAKRGVRNITASMAFDTPPSHIYMMGLTSSATRKSEPHLVGLVPNQVYNDLSGEYDFRAVDEISTPRYVEPADEDYRETMDSLLCEVSGGRLVSGKSSDIRPLVFPVTSELPISKYSTKLSYAYRADNFKEFVERLVGKRRAKKSIVKAIASSLTEDNSDKRISGLNAFPSDVPIDLLRTFLNERDTYRYDAARFKDFLRATYHGDGRRILKLLEIGKKPNPGWMSDEYLLLDADRMWIQIGKPALPKLKNASEYHEYLTVLHHNKRYPNKEIDYEKIDSKNRLRSIEGASYKDLYISLPKNTNEIAQWGTKQRHCIASYAYDMVDGKDALFAVNDSRDGSLCYNGRISNGRLVELRGFANQSAPRDVHIWAEGVVGRSFGTAYRTAYTAHQEVEWGRRDREPQPLVF